MKRMITAWVFLLLAAIAGIFGQFRLQQETNILCRTTEILEMHAENEQFEAALDTANTLAAQWETTHRRICLFVNHNALDNTEKLVTLLPQLCREKNSNAIYRSCQSMRQQLDHLVQSEMLRWENIL